MYKRISSPIAIGIIVFLAVLVGGIVLWQYLGMSRIEISEFKPAEKVQPADETADWKTYRNEELGFGIKYPSYLEAEKDINNPNTIIIDDIDPYNDPCAAGYFITIDETEYEDIDKWAIDFQKDIEEPLDYEGATFERKVISIENIDIQGKTGKRISLGLPSFPLFNEHIGIINNEKLYLIQYILLGSCQGKERNEEDIIFNQILSTFRFFPVNKELLNYIKNSEYILSGGETVKLTNGYWEKEKRLGFYSAEINNITIGDLNEDEREDAAVILIDRAGGSGAYFRVFGIIAQDGKFSKTEPIFIDDRAIINSISIDFGIITLDAVVHGPWDSMAEPTLKKIFRYKIEGNKLVDIDLTSYKNEKYGYEINVLPGWEVWNSSSFERKTIAKKGKSGRGDVALEVSIEGLNQNIYNLLIWMKNNYKSDYYYYPFDWISINGHSGYRTYAHAALCGGVPTIDTFILVKGIIFHFSCLINIQECPTNYPISDSSDECDKMIESFKIN